jgi:3-deoxy-manno-octulosonate cytidylyltransferase (CMP-KDO synthetase)
VSERTVGLIPARLESSRLPKKALVDICGLPMIVHVYHRTRLARSLSDVFVATDSDEIRHVVEAHGGHVIMTRTTHQTGTDRIAEAAASLPSDIKVVTNTRGDILYLSRSDIPSSARTAAPPMLKGYHVLAFRKPFLLQFASWTPGPLETIEFIEHLRILERGASFRAVTVESSAVSVDTADDLEYVRAQMASDDLVHTYRSRA